MAGSGPGLLFYNINGRTLTENRDPFTDTSIEPLTRHDQPFTNAALLDSIRNGTSATDELGLLQCNHREVAKLIWL